jgi:hypothetical protein
VLWGLREGAGAGVNLEVGYGVEVGSKLGVGFWGHSLQVATVAGLLGSKSERYCN